ncbi:MAG: helix-turn-helix transcriptional regulator [Thermoanaerobaculia bacterium]|nr:helix-turn-helix transcriptional regulator [Thermoanaerobaculia bacterium]
MTRTSLGELEERLLLALLHVGPESYSVALVAELEARTGRSVSPAAAHMVLRRLEKRGFVTSRMGDPTPERGGRAKRLYRPTPAATEALRTSRRELQGLWEGLPAELEP